MIVVWARIQRLLFDFNRGVTMFTHPYRWRNYKVTVRWHHTLVKWYTRPYGEPTPFKIQLDFVKPNWWSLSQADLSLSIRLESFKRRRLETFEATWDYRDYMSIIATMEVECQQHKGNKFEIVYFLINLLIYIGWFCCRYLLYKGAIITRLICHDSYHLHYSLDSIVTSRIPLLMYI